MWRKCCLILATTLLTAGSLPAASPATLGLVVRRNIAVPTAVRQQFELETAEAIRQSLHAENLLVTWRDEGALAGGESFDRLIVVSLQGDCSTVMPNNLQSIGPLGWTSTADERVLPFIGIDCTRVKAALAGSGGWPQSMLPAGTLARAMSRVAMHEIYHVLSERKHHDTEGLFKAEYSAADLLGPAVLFHHSGTGLAGLPVRP